MIQRVLSRVGKSTSNFAALLALTLLLLSGAAAGDSQGSSSWPVDQQGLEFAFATAFDDVFAYGPMPRKRLSHYALSPSGRARVATYGALDPGYGFFLAPGQGEIVGKAVAGRSAMSLEFLLERMAPRRARSGPILGIRTASGEGGFAIFQGIDSIDATLTTSGSGEYAERIVLCTLPSPEPHHIALSYENGELTCYIDGQERGRSDGFRGTLGDWSDGELRIGSGEPASPGWAGRIEGIAIYSRARSAEEIRSSAEAYARRVAARDAVPRLRIELRLLARPRVSTPTELAPDRDSLSVFEYEVVKVHEGEYGGKRIRVAHWSVLDGEVMPFTALAVGDTIAVEVEPLEAHRQLEGVEVLQTLEPNDLPVFFDAGGLSTWYAPR